MTNRKSTIRNDPVENTQDDLIGIPKDDLSGNFQDELFGNTSDELFGNTLDELSGMQRVDPDSEALGPSDTSDSGSDVPRAMRGSDSDSQGTGERASVEPADRQTSEEDLTTDKVVREDQAGLSHSAPDPVRNGGK